MFCIFLAATTLFMALFVAMFESAAIANAIAKAITGLRLALSTIGNAAIKVWSLLQDFRGIVGTVFLGTGSSILGSILVKIGEEEPQSSTALVFAIIFLVSGAIAAGKDKR
jgi:hypothetical protein